MSSTALSLSSIPTVQADVSEEQALEERSRRAAGAVVDRLVGDKASTEFKAAATEVVAPWAARLVRVMDDYMVDPIVGFLVPGAGDVITGTGSIALLFLALKEGVPTVILFRMLLNILVDTIGGFFPFVGDAFDLVWRSNRRNLHLIEEYGADGEREPMLRDYLLVGAGVLLAVASAVIPLLLVYGVGGAVLWTLLS